MTGSHVKTKCRPSSSAQKDSEGTKGVGTSHEKHIPVSCILHVSSSMSHPSLIPIPAEGQSQRMLPSASREWRRLSATLMELVKACQGIQFWIAALFLTSQILACQGAPVNAGANLCQWWRKPASCQQRIVTLLGQRTSLKKDSSI